MAESGVVGSRGLVDGGVLGMVGSGVVGVYGVVGV